MATKLENAIKSIEKDLKTLTAKIGKFAKELTALAKKKPAKKAAAKKAPAKKKAAPKKKAAVKKAPAKKAPPKKKAVKKAPAKKAAKGATAYDKVVDIIKRSKTGVDNASLMKKTGFDAKKVANIIYKAKNKKDIKAIKKGVYTKA